ncbi:MAG TPA: NUDIX domain-containing protein [Bacteroidia bacterium]|nr:NUDIX domain-containing protein [Bacteroidia bacterium]
MNEYSLPRPIFNVRIYGILHHNECILVSDEIHVGRKITKFPGGGLQFGEGTIEGLKREFREELDIDIDIVNHFYTTDFFQPSVFDATQQVISIYYVVASKNSENIKVNTEKFMFLKNENGEQFFRWVELKKLQQSEFTFPIDQHVAELLIEQHQGL